MDRAEKRPYVAIIGGGTAGVATLKALVTRGIKCRLFEGRPRLGGLWVEVYPGGKVQTHNCMYAFADWKWSSGAPTYPGGPEIVSYVESYATEFDLWPSVHLNTAVESITCTDSSLQTEGAPQEATSILNLDCKPRFLVKYRSTTDESKTYSDTFTHVVMATGGEHKPKFCNLSGSESFPGTILHSSQRKNDKKEFSGKRVVVVGSGKSALDACMAAVEAGSTSVTQLLRTQHWLYPQQLSGLPSHHLIHHPIMSAASVPVAGLQRSPLARGVRAALWPARWLLFKNLEAAMLLLYRLPRRMWPKHSVIEQQYASVGATFTHAYLKALRKGSLQYEKGTVDSLCNAGIIVKSNAKPQKNGATTLLPADTVICATGFDHALEPLSKTIIQEVQDGHGDVYLYKHMLNPNVPGLFFSGTVHGPHSIPFLSSIQGAWIGEVLTGGFTLPPRSTIDADLERMRRDYSSYWNFPARASMIFNMDRYMLDLMQQMKTDHLARFGGPFGPLADGLVSVTPEKYSNAIQIKDKRLNHMLKPSLRFKITVLGVLGVVVHSMRKQRIPCGAGSSKQGLRQTAVKTWKQAIAVGMSIKDRPRRMGGKQMK